MGFFDFLKRKEKVIVKDVSPDTASVYVQDTTSGEAITTVTKTSGTTGRTSTSRTVSFPSGSRTTTTITPPPTTQKTKTILTSQSELGRQQAIKQALIIQQARELKTQKELEKRQSIVERRKLKPRERIRKAFQGAGKGSEVYGVGRAFVETVSIGAERVGIARSDEKIMSGKGRVGRVDVFTETMLFVGLSAPLTTTTQIYKAVQPTRVLFKGVQQTIKQGTVKTDVIFTTSTGKKGVATGVTQTTMKGNKIISRTLVAGKEVSRRVIFPSGKEIIKVTSKFKGAELGIAKQGTVTFTRQVTRGVTATGTHQATAQISFGKVIVKGKGAEKFVSSSVGFQQDKLSLIFGKTISTKGEAIAGGIIKKLSDSVTRTFITTGGRAGTTTALTKSVALTGVKGVVSTAVTSITTPTGTIFPAVVSAFRTTPKSTPIIQTAKLDLTQVPTISVTTTSKPTITTVPTSIIATTTATTSGVKSIQSSTSSSIQKEIFKQPTAVVSVETTKQTQVSKSILKTPLIQQQAQSMRVFSLPFTPKTTTLKVFPLSFKLKKGFSTQGAGTFGVSVRQRGVFKPIGSGLSLSKAISVGQQRVGSTLSATFKLTPEKKGKQVGGIRTPKGFKRKKGLIFIEQPEFRLSTGKEVAQIQMAKRLKI